MVKRTVPPLSVATHLCHIQLWVGALILVILQIKTRLIVALCVIRSLTLVFQSFPSFVCDQRPNREVELNNNEIPIFRVVLWMMMIPKIGFQ